MEYIFLVLTFSKLLADVKKRIKIKKIISDALSLLNQKSVCSPLKAVTTCWFVFTTPNMQRNKLASWLQASTGWRVLAAQEEQ